MTNRLLTDRQIEEACELIIDGLSLTQTCEKCAELFNVRIAKSTLHGYPEIQKAIRRRESVRRIETKEALDKSLPKFVDILLARIARNEESTKKLEAKIEEEQAKEDPKSRLLAGYYSQLRELDKVLKQLLAEYRQFYNDSSARDSDFNDAATQSVEERMRRLENMLADPLAALQSPRAETYDEAIGDPQEMN